MKTTNCTKKLKASNNNILISQIVFRKNYIKKFFCLTRLKTQKGGKEERVVLKKYAEKSN